MNDFNQLDNFFTSPKKERQQKPRSGFLERIRNYFPTKEQLYYLPRVLSAKERGALIALMIFAIFSLIAMPIGAYYQGTTSAPSNGGSWKEAMIGVPQHINPLLLQANDVDSDLTKIIYAGLLRYNEEGKLTKQLAESYSISDDGLSYTFTLKQGLKWHDEQPLTSDDVVFTILTAQNSDYASTQRTNWQGVEITKIDDLTVVFKLKNRYAQFINNTTLGILPKHVWQNVKSSNFGLSEINLKPIGSGPYKFSKIRKDSLGTVSSIELSSFDDYAEGKPNIERVTFNFYDSEKSAISAFDSGDADGISSVSAERISDVRGSYELKNLQLPRYFAIFFNPTKNRPLSEKNVRIALTHATNKEKLVSEVLDDKGTIVNSPLLPGIIEIKENTENYSFDIEKAKELLESSGWKIGENGIRTKEFTIDGTKQTVHLEIKITTSGWPELTSVAQNIENQWKDAGVKVTIEVLSVSEIQQSIKDRNYDALLFGEVLGLNPDPFSFWHSSQKKEPGLNLAIYESKDADKLLEDARQTLDDQERKNRYEQLQNIIIKDAPALLLYSPNYLYIQPKKIKGNDYKVIAIPANRFDNIHKWYIDTKRVKK